MVRQIRPGELAELIGRGELVKLLDVRTDWERRVAAIPGDRHIPLDELPWRIDEVEAGGELVVVYCHLGIRSLSGAAILQANGVENVASLAGGIDAWSAEVDGSVPRY